MTSSVIARASFLFLVVSSSSAYAQDNCPWWRPCGPGNTWGGNRLVKQGAGGVDFRPACAAHDACFADPSIPRKVCDRQFLANMQAGCECSDKPLLCRLKAKQAYLTVRVFGAFYPRGRGY